MNIVVDVILIFIFAATVVQFYRKGFVKSLFSLCRLFASIIIAFAFTSIVADLVNNKLLAFILLFIAAMIACGILSSVIDKLFSLPILKEINKLFGLALGAVCGFLYALVASSAVTLVMNILSWRIPNLSAELLMEETVVYSFLSRIDIVHILFYH